MLLLLLLLLLLGSCRLLGSYGNVDARVRLGREVAHDGFPRRNAEIEWDKSIKWTYSCIYTEINGYSAIRITITRPWSSLVAGDEWLVSAQWSLKFGYCRPCTFSIAFSIHCWADTILHLPLAVALSDSATLPGNPPPFFDAIVALQTQHASLTSSMIPI